MLCILCNFRWSSFTGFILPSHPCLHPCSSGADTSAQVLLWHPSPSFTHYEHQLMEGGSKTQNGWNHTAAHQRNRSWKYTLYPMTRKLSLLRGCVFGLQMYLPCKTARQTTSTCDLPQQSYYSMTSLSSLESLLLWKVTWGDFYFCLFGSFFFNKTVSQASWWATSSHQSASASTKKNVHSRSFMFCWGLQLEEKTKERREAHRGTATKVGLNILLNKGL